ncbi:MAG TPA: fatty acid desaturase [Methylococcaceae bacterium]|nr:fatty acid desaturase [Methylococcaceae bacterium]
MLTGFLNIPVWGLVIVALVLTHITIASVTIFLHRHQAHRALDIHPIMSHFFRFWLWLTTGMITKEWVAVHRKHHAKCETVEDPHSPQVFGIRKVLLEGAELYTQQAEDPKTTEKYGTGTPDDWLENNVYRRFPHVGLAIMLTTDVALFGVLGLTVWAVQMLWIPFWAAGVINGLGHYRGYRNFETQDAATNLFPIAILIGGEELHNNHHAYPSSAKLSSKWWEFDIGWFYIRVMEILKLARVKRRAPKSRIEWEKPLADRETLLAVVKNRFHVMALYGRRVVVPVLRIESKIADAPTRRLLKKARPLMVREYLRPDEAARTALNRALETSEALATVYRFKEQLRALWTNASFSPEKRLEALREWCRQAEATGIQCLQNFAAVLRGYSVCQSALA